MDVRRLRVWNLLYLCYLFSFLPQSISSTLRSWHLRLYCTNYSVHYFDSLASDQSFHSKGYMSQTRDMARYQVAFFYPWQHIATAVVQAAQLLVFSLKSFFDF